MILTIFWICFCIVAIAGSINATYKLNKYKPIDHYYWEAIYWYILFAFGILMIIC